MDPLDGCPVSGSRKAQNDPKNENEEILEELSTSAVEGLSLLLELFRSWLNRLNAYGKKVGETSYSRLRYHKKTHVVPASVADPGCLSRI